MQIKESLNFDKIQSIIEIENHAGLAGIEILETIDSTNSYLLKRVKEGIPSGTFCFAEEQTLGRGRCGRSWFSPSGVNIYCSLFWTFPSKKDIADLSIAIAVMVTHALKQYGIAAGLQLKWPNDVLFSNRKLAGILLERNEYGVVIGIGINLYLPPEADPSWISVQEIMNKDTPLLNHLIKNQINHLIIAGMMTHMCIDASVRAAYDLGFTCTVLHDACATKNLEFNSMVIPAQSVHNAFLAALQPLYANVLTVKDFLHAMGMKSAVGA